MKLSCFFIKQFLATFVVAFGILVVIFATSDLFMRSGTITSIAMVPSFFITMLPIMALLALPLAAGLAVAIPIGSLLINDELMFIVYVQRARGALHRSVLFCSIFLAVIYACLIFWWAPQSHLLGKQMLLSLASSHFAQLEPNKFHAPLPGLTLYFKQKSVNTTTKEVSFQTIFLSYFKGKDQYLFTAKKGYIREGILYLFSGGVYSVGQQQHAVQFDETEINFKHFFEDIKDSKRLSHLKFLTFKHLYKCMGNDRNVFGEFHKRIAQVLWQFLFPFFGLMGIMVFGRRKSNLLFSLLSIGGLYIFSYASSAAGQSLVSCAPALIAFLYLCPLIIFIVLFRLYWLR